MRHALTILTYVRADANDHILKRLPEALRSLRDSGYDGPTVVVDDGSTHPDHLAYLKSLPPEIEVVTRPENGGISRAKNTCLRVLGERDIDVGFLSEDDIQFHPGWAEAYLTAHAKTDIEHFCWVSDTFFRRLTKTPRQQNGFTVVEPSRLNGVFLTVTPRVLSTVGGFRVLPRPWGHEHIHWTRRIVKAGLAPFPCDIAHSNRVITLNRYAEVSTVPQQCKQKWSRENQPGADDISQVYWRLEE